MLRRHQLFGLVSLLAIACPTFALAAKDDDKYRSADAAVGDAIKYLEKKDYKSAQAPLEAALKLAPDDAYRLRVYDYLMACYRQLPDPAKMTEAVEFSIVKTKENANRSLTCRSFASYLFAQGKTDEARKKYEQRLEKDAEDLVALSVLNGINQHLRSDRAKRDEYRDRLTKAEQKKNGEQAEEEETLAKSDKDATWHWKQAAVYWIRAASPKKALKAAKQADATGPEKRSDILLYYWHTALADVYMEAESPADAVPHLEEALASARTASSKKDCEQKLALAKLKADAK
jgi:Tfp pilus assembly protein PilF